MRIVIAEDDNVSRLLVQAMLTRSGHTVETADDGAEAWQILQQADPPRGRSLSGRCRAWTAWRVASRPGRSTAQRPVPHPVDRARKNGVVWTEVHST
jgi:CheY-like chemotaxis protein